MAASPRRHVGTNGAQSRKEACEQVKRKRSRWGADRPPLFFPAVVSAQLLESCDCIAQFVQVSPLAA